MPAYYATVPAEEARVVLAGLAAQPATWFCRSLVDGSLLVLSSRELPGFQAADTDRFLSTFLAGYPFGPVAPPVNTSPFPLLPRPAAAAAAPRGWFHAVLPDELYTRMLELAIPELGFLWEPYDEDRVAVLSPVQLAGESEDSFWVNAEVLEEVLYAAMKRGARYGGLWATSPPADLHALPDRPMHWSANPNAHPGLTMPPFDATPLRRAVERFRDF